ncbi:DnaJ-class molecular chaperone with C-terminal Zn finger domain [Haloferax denitrificans ATCC 35960]|uniref:DnaJ-class molecular chaperone with C-terminal Zn finger domain n=1 Tax=Haloferax denitrificans ATCC 35960 TaxID=662478 RepID=M0ITW7_9EURY|nr:DnaJ-class molecular chaperone with C-terminal Zn finger domain [Haloferax denitrificans ATCC 35960]
MDFYELLGVERDAETAEIKQAFRQRAREYHPDVNDDERATAQFTVVRKAYEVLTDDAERADYDRMGHGPYVEKRLDGLTKFKYPGKDGKNGGRGKSGTGGRSASRRSSAGRSASSSSTTSSSSSSRSSSQRASSSSRRSSSASSSSRSGRSRASGSSSSSRTAGASQSSAAGGSSRGRTRTSESGRSGRTGTTGRFERGRDGSESAATTAPPSGATNPLWYGWSVSLVALVAYLGGFAWHLAGDGAGFAAALASLDTAAPAAGLLASSPLSPAVSHGTGGRGDAGGARPPGRGGAPRRLAHGGHRPVRPRVDHVGLRARGGRPAGARGGRRGRRRPARRGRPPRLRRLPAPRGRRLRRRRRVVSPRLAVVAAARGRPRPRFLSLAPDGPV